MLSDEVRYERQSSPRLLQENTGLNVLAKQPNQVIGLERLLNVRIALRLSKEG